MITIIDYGMGNLGSIKNMLKKLGVSSIVTSDANDIANAEKLILPGVGAFDTGMTRLKECHLLEVLNQKVLGENIPVLGICLGMQLMTQQSEEGVLPGLGWIKAKTIRFQFKRQETDLKVPHMGWNIATPIKDDTLFCNIAQPARFYFVHSFHVVCEEKSDVLAMTEYGLKFCSVIRRGNIMATQFHPEKSHRFGMQLFENFIKL